MSTGSIEPSSDRIARAFEAAVQHPSQAAFDDLADAIEPSEREPGDG